MSDESDAIKTAFLAAAEAIEHLDSLHKQRVLHALSVLFPTRRRRRRRPRSER